MINKQVYKKNAAAILAAAMVLTTSSAALVPSWSYAAEAKTELVNGGEFKTAQLNEEHLTPEYRLTKYDVINVLVTGFPNGIGVNDIMVGPDGYVQLPYVGMVKLAGLTIDETTALLTEALGEYIKIPGMSVMIKSYGPRKVYVMGAVNSPGIKEISIDSMNVYAAVSAGGGIAKKGRPKHIQVLRPIGDTMYYREINLDRFVKEHDLTQNLELQDGDIIYVPESNKIIFSEDILPYISMYGVWRGLTK